MRRSGLAGTIILGSRRLDETRGIGAVPVRRLSPKPVLIRCGDRHVAAHSHCEVGKRGSLCAGMSREMVLWALRVVTANPENTLSRPALYERGARGRHIPSELDTRTPNAMLARPSSI